MISSFGQDGDTLLACQFMEEMMKSKITPNNITFNAIIEVFSKSGDTEGCVTWYHFLNVQECVFEFSLFFPL